jgi:hypothetical protein
MKMTVEVKLWGGEKVQRDRNVRIIGKLCLSSENIDKIHCDMMFLRDGSTARF